MVEDGRFVLDGASVEGDGTGSVGAEQIQITESELRGVTFAPRSAALRLRDVALSACDLSNLDGREASLRRVEIRDSRLTGFGLVDAEAEDVKILNSSLTLASFGSSRLRRVIFEGVDLTETSFIDAQLDAVAFVSCRLAGADFRRARLRSCAIRGTSLDGIVGIESLRGVTMPWVDVLESAAAMAAVLGIRVEQE